MSSRLISSTSSYIEILFVVEMPATDRRTSHNDVQMLNMNFMKDVKLLSEAKNNNGAQPADPPTLNIQRVSAFISFNWKVYHSQFASISM